MPDQAWLGLNDIQVENEFVYTDGTPAVGEAMNTMNVDQEMLPNE